MEYGGVRLNNLKTDYKTATTVTIPSRIGDETVSEIDENLLSECQGILNIVVEPGFSDEAGLNKQLENVLKSCSTMESLTISLDEASRISFANWSTLEELTLTLPEGAEAWLPVDPFRGTQIKELTIGAGRVTMDSGVFENCTTLTKVTLLNSSNVGERMFAGCTGLTTVEMPNVEYVGISAFAGCTALETVVFPQHVFTIEGWAFEGCTSLSSIDLRYVGSTAAGAFKDCGTLQITALPTAMGMAWFASDTFQGCTISGWGTNPKIESSTGLVYTVSGNAGSETATVCDYLYKNATPLDGVTGSDTMNIPVQITYSETYPDGTGSNTTYPLVKIGDSVFENNNRIRTLSIGNDVLNESGMTIAIGDKAFKKCSALESVGISVNVNVSSIGAEAFYECTAIKRFDLADSSDMSIGTNAFYGIPALLTYATVYDEGATQVLGVSVNGLSFVSRNATEIVIPEKYDEYDVIKIAPEAFAGNSAITKLTVQAQNLVIGDKAFSGCSNLKEVTLPNNENARIKIGSLAFENCAMEKMDLSSVESLEAQAFSGSQSLREIYLPQYIPESELKVKEDAFQNCSGLGWGDNPQIDPNTFLIYSTAVDPTDNVSYATIYGYYKKNVQYDAMGNTYQYDIDVPSSLGDAGVIAIADEAFANSGNLLEATIDGEYIDDQAPVFARIGASAFKGCTSLSRFEVTQLPGLTEIGASAFEGCTLLSQVQLYEATNLKYIGASAFADCKQLTLVQCYNNRVEPGTSQYAVYLSNTMTVGDEAFKNCSSLNRRVMLPDSPAEGQTEILGTGVFAGTEITAVTVGNGNGCSIPANAFAEVTTITEVSLYGVSNIGESAFKGCTGLITVELYYVESIGESAFKGCTGLITVELDDVESIGASAFEDCTALQSIMVRMKKENYDETLGVTVDVEARIESRAFANCSAITAFEITDCDECADDAFEGVTIPSAYAVATEIRMPEGADMPEIYVNGLSIFNLDATVLTIPSNGKYIDANGMEQYGHYSGIAERAFADNINLTQVSIAEGERFSLIGANAFSGCTNLETVAIPSTVTKIEAGAFEGCTNLKAVYVPYGCEIEAGAFSASTTVYTATELEALPDNYRRVTERLKGYYDETNGIEAGPHDGLSQELMQQTGLINAVVETMNLANSYLVPEGYTHYAFIPVEVDENVELKLASWSEYDEVPETRSVWAEFENTTVLAAYYDDEATGERKYLITPKLVYGSRH